MNSRTARVQHIHIAHEHRAIPIPNIYMKRSINSSEHSYVQCSTNPKEEKEKNPHESSGDIDGKHLLKDIRNERDGDTTKRI